MLLIIVSKPLNPTTDVRSNDPIFQWENTFRRVQHTMFVRICLCQHIVNDNVHPLLREAYVSMFNLFRGKRWHRCVNTVFNTTTSRFHDTLRRATESRNILRETVAVNTPMADVDLMPDYGNPAKDPAAWKDNYDATTEYR